MVAISIIQNLKWLLGFSSWFQHSGVMSECEALMVTKNGCGSKAIYHSGRRGRRMTKNHINFSMMIHSSLIMIYLPKSEKEIVYSLHRSTEHLHWSCSVWTNNSTINIGLLSIKILVVANYVMPMCKRYSTHVKWFGPWLLPSKHSLSRIAAANIIVPQCRIAWS